MEAAEPQTVESLERQQKTVRIRQFFEQQGTADKQKAGLEQFLRGAPETIPGNPHWVVDKNDGSRPKVYRTKKALHKAYGSRYQYEKLGGITKHPVNEIVVLEGNGHAVVPVHPRFAEQLLAGEASPGTHDMADLRREMNREARETARLTARATRRGVARTSRGGEDGGTVRLLFPRAPVGAAARAPSPGVAAAAKAAAQKSPRRQSPRRPAGRFGGSARRGRRVRALQD